MPAYGQNFAPLATQVDAERIPALAGIALVVGTAAAIQKFGNTTHAMQFATPGHCDRLLECCVKDASLTPEAVEHLEAQPIEAREEMRAFLAERIRAGKPLALRWMWRRGGRKSQKVELVTSEEGLLIKQTLI